MASHTESHKMRARMKDGKAEIKLLINHPMETGTRKDPATGLVIPRYFIRELVCEHNGKPVLRTQWNWGIARNPFLSFRIRTARSGDTIRVWWVDDRGMEDGVEGVVT